MNILTNLIVSIVSAVFFIGVPSPVYSKEKEQAPSSTILKNQVPQPRPGVQSVTPSLGYYIELQNINSYYKQDLKFQGSLKSTDPNAILQGKTIVVMVDSTIVGNGSTDPAGQFNLFIKPENLSLKPGKYTVHAQLKRYKGEPEVSKNATLNILSYQGACIVLDKESYNTVLGPYSQGSDPSKPFFKQNMGNVLTLDELKSKCTDAVLQPLKTGYCKSPKNRDSGWYIGQLYDAVGTPYSRQLVNIKDIECSLVGFCELRAGHQTNGVDTIPMPAYNAPDFGTGYARMKIGTIPASSIVPTAAKCTNAVYQQLLQTYCQLNVDPYRGANARVIFYHESGVGFNFKISGVQLTLKCPGVP